ncbi:hypothetical protein [Palleronia rufa]|uniref:hypothetical protein n=1 Tax=Palleronia rufa TaxID=1530186 RepID=UPI00056C81D7|nr:hypothetical protein [Palleronia rufa]
MLIVLDQIDAETTAILRAPMAMPHGAALQVISLEHVLGGGDALRLTLSLALSDEARTGAVADWLWDRLEDAAPLVIRIGGTRARVAEAAALAWLIDRARGEG